LTKLRVLGEGTAEFLSCRFDPEDNLIATGNPFVLKNWDMIEHHLNKPSIVFKHWKLLTKRRDLWEFVRKGMIEAEKGIFF